MAADLVRRHNEELLETLEDGDMIEFNRGIYSHWAVYIGEGKVIHLVADRNSTLSGTGVNFFSISGVLSKKAYVREDDLIKVAADSKAIKNNNKDNSFDTMIPLQAEEIVERAKSLKGETVDYSIYWHNCEYFASWCRYGVGWSEQAIHALIAAGLLVGVGILAGAAAAAKSVSDEEKEKKVVLPK